MPAFLCPIHESNDCHEPAGSPVGGQFCSGEGHAAQALLAPYGEYAADLKAVQRQLLERMAADGNEHMAVLQPGRPLFFHTSGESTYVEVPHDDFIAELQANPPIFTAHTHPTGSAPSEADLRIQIRTRTPRQVIFGDHGEWYELVVTDMAAADQAVGEGRRKATYWEPGTKGKFSTAFTRQKTRVSKEAARVTDAWAATRYGWTQEARGKDAGFHTPEGAWLSRGDAGTLHPEIREYYTARFAEQSPRIWVALAKKYPWLTFRYHAGGGS